MLTALLALTCIAFSAGSAAARTLPGQLSVLPARPSTTATLHFSYRPSTEDSATATYRAVLFVLDRQRVDCRGSLAVMLEKTSGASETLTADLAPQGSHLQSYPWCSGRALLSVIREHSGRGLTDGRVARRES